MVKFGEFREFVDSNGVPWKFGTADDSFIVNWLLSYYQYHSLLNNLLFPKMKKF